MDIKPRMRPKDCPVTGLVVMCDSIYASGDTVRARQAKSVLSGAHRAVQEADGDQPNKYVI